MINPDKIFGRLGNRLFQSAFLYSYAKDNNIDFFFQDPKFFSKHESEIQELFGTDIGFVPQVSLHVRRGDYVNNPFYVDLTKTDYYDKAIAMFPNRTFLVFSDDIEFCKTEFEGDRFIFVENQTELEDLNLMASCEHNIVANSSFSYWAGYLNQHPNKIVVAPKVERWYADGTERTVCPKEWIRI